MRTRHEEIERVYLEATDDGGVVLDFGAHEFVLDRAQAKGLLDWLAANLYDPSDLLDVEDESDPCHGCDMPRSQCVCDLDD